jgi:hypothetical protein
MTAFESGYSTAFGAAEHFEAASEALAAHLSSAVMRQPTESLFTQLVVILVSKLIA